MKVWLLCKKEHFSNYENRRFSEVSQNMGIDFNLVSPEDFDILITTEKEKQLLYRGNQCDFPNSFIPRMGAGTNSFALNIIRHFENLKIFVLNRSKSIEQAKNKFITYQILNSKNIPVPKTILVKFPLNIRLIEEFFSYPIIIKPVTGSYGKGIYLVENRNQLEDLMDLIEILKSESSYVLVQEFIKDSAGKDIRVLVLNNKAIGAMLRVAKEGKFKSNFSCGGSVQSFKMNSEIEDLAVKASKAIDLEFAGVDILFNKNSYTICEVNSAPGFEGFEKVTGLNIAEIIFKFIKKNLNLIVKD